jgi:hypothetical protein
MDHAGDCLICSRERKAAMRSFGPTADRGPFAQHDWAEKGFAMISNLGARPIVRVTIAILMSLALVFVIMASANPASARPVRHKRSVSSQFIGPPADQPLTDFKCHWVNPTAQYFCQATRTDKQKSPPIGFALEALNPGDVGLFADQDPPDNIDAKDFTTPRTFSCSLKENADPKNPANYSCAYGKNPCFTLDKAMAIKKDEETEDGQIKEVFIDTWFMPRHKNC